MPQFSRLDARADLSSSNELNRTEKYVERVTQTKICYGVKNTGSVGSFATKQSSVAQRLWNV